MAKAKLVISAGVILLLAVVALAAPWLAPKDPLGQDLMLATLPPVGWDGAVPGYWLGTDDLGRDVLSRLMYGSRVALIVAVAAAGGAALIGTILGLVAGWYGAAADRAISWLIAVWMAFPPVLLSILLVAVLNPGLVSVIVAIVMIDWTRFARVVRAETQAQGRLDYITAANSMGFSRSAILFREILPNVWPVLIALISLEMGIAVSVEAILSFVGLSVSSDVPSWGGMIAQGRQILYQGWWVLAAPLGLLFAAVLAFNWLGESLRRLCDPVMRR